jgi:hypothetical protein
MYRFSKNPQISNVMKILPMEAELFQAGGHTHTHARARARARTDMKKLIVAISNFANAVCLVTK